MANEPYLISDDCINEVVLADFLYPPYSETRLKDWRDHPGKEMKKDGREWRSYWFKVKVVSHPTIAEGETAILSVTDTDGLWTRMCELNPKKGDRLEFRVKMQKNKETGRSYKVTTIARPGEGDAEPAPAPASRPAPRQQPQAERHAAQRPAPAQAIRPEPGSEDTFSRALHLHKDLLRHFRENVSVESEPTPDWPAAQAMAATLMIQWEKLGYPVTPWERAERESGAAHVKPAQQPAEDDDGGYAGVQDDSIPFDPDFSGV